jgi:hypothetical protein
MTDPFVMGALEAVVNNRHELIQVETGPEDPDDEENNARKIGNCPRSILDNRGRNVRNSRKQHFNVVFVEYAFTQGVL